MELLNQLTRQLRALDGDGLTRRRRTVDSPCGPRVTVDGREVKVGLKAPADWTVERLGPARFRLASRGPVADRNRVTVEPTKRVEGKKAPRGAVAYTEEQVLSRDRDWSEGMCACVLTGGENPLS